MVRAVHRSTKPWGAIPAPQVTVQNLPDPTSRLDRLLSRGGSIATVFTAVAAAAGLLFTAQQLSENARAQTKNTAAQQRTLEAHLQEQMTGLDRYFADHPQLRTYFYDSDAPIPAGSLLDETKSVSEMIIDLAATIAPSVAAMPDDRKDRWTRIFKAYYCDSLVLERTWWKNARFYSFETEALLAGCP
jgi:hypothetical protein